MKKIKELALLAHRPVRRNFSEGGSLGVGGSVPKGFTLIELLVVSVILTLLSIVIAQIFFTSIRTNTKTGTIQEVKASGDRAIEMMSRLVQNAPSIQLPASCPEDATGSELDSITLINFDEGETTLSCVDDAERGIARIASVSAAQTVYLTQENVSVFDAIGSANACTNHALSFTCSSVGGTPSYVTINFTLRQANTQATMENTSSASFQTTVTVRNR
jgi:prepilin-type N-terminal cleavage/methylation domain-containing protein